MNCLLVYTDICHMVIYLPARWLKYQKWQIWAAQKLNSFERLGRAVTAKHHQFKYSKLHTKANSEFHLRMKQSELDVPYFWQYFVAKSSLGRSIRRFAPCVWWKYFGSHLVEFRCVRARQRERKWANKVNFGEKGADFTDDKYPPKTRSTRLGQQP